MPHGADFRPFYPVFDTGKPSKKSNESALVSIKTAKSPSVFFLSRGYDVRGENTGNRSF